MTKDAIRRRGRVAVAVVPVIVLVLLNYLFDKAHDLSFWAYRTTDRAVEGLANWIAGEDMQA